MYFDCNTLKSRDWPTHLNSHTPPIRAYTLFFLGGAIGASSILLIQPQDSSNNVKSSNELSKRKLNENSCSNCGSVFKERLGQCHPNGIVVAIIVNMQEVSLSKVAFSIAEHFKSDL